MKVFEDGDFLTLQGPEDLIELRFNSYIERTGDTHYYHVTDLIKGEEKLAKFSDAKGEERLEGEAVLVRKITGEGAICFSRQSFYLSLRSEEEGTLSLHIGAPIGTRLVDSLDSKGKLPLPRLLTMAKDLIRGLAALHRTGYTIKLRPKVICYRKGEGPGEVPDDELGFMIYNLTTQVKLGTSNKEENLKYTGYRYYKTRTTTHLTMETLGYILCELGGIELPYVESKEPRPSTPEEWKQRSWEVAQKKWAFTRAMSNSSPRFIHPESPFKDRMARYFRILRRGHREGREVYDELLSPFVS